jgi:hypothetical protein
MICPLVDDNDRPPRTSGRGREDCVARLAFSGGFGY